MRSVVMVQRTYDSECWEWTGPQIAKSGYGKFRVTGQPERPTHVLMWEHYNGGAVPEKHTVDHLCRNTICCNPSHLEAVLHSENVKRQDHAERRKTHCPKGHPYDDENTITRRGRRECRTCDRERKRVSSR